MAEQLDKLIYLSGVYGAEPYSQPNNIVSTPVVATKQLSPSESGRMIATYFQRDVSRDITATNVYTNSQAITATELTSYDYNVPIIQTSFSVKVNKHDAFKKGRTVEQEFSSMVGQIQGSIRNITQARLASNLTGVFDTALASHYITTYNSGGWDGNAVRTVNYDLFGERADTIQYLIMHSAQLAQIQNTEIVPQFKGSTVNGQDIMLNRYMNKTILINDTLCAPTGNVYPTYLVGGGALGVTYRNNATFEDVTTTVAGGTVERVFTFDFASEVLGVDFSGSYPTADSGITTGSNYNLVWDSKEVKIAKIDFLIGA